MSDPNICIVIKSTVPIGFSDHIQNLYPSTPILFSPEFLREDQSISDTLSPSRIIVGSNKENEGKSLQFLDISKATAVMVARGGVGHPRLVEQLNHYFETGEKLPDATLEENIKYLWQFVDMLIEEKGEYKAMMLLRGIATKFFDGYPNTKKIRNAIAQSLTTRDSLVRILSQIDK